MIKEIICMWLLWILLKLFGQEIVCISTVCSFPDSALQILNKYIQEVPE